MNPPITATSMAGGDTRRTGPRAMATRATRTSGRGRIGRAGGWSARRDERVLVLGQVHRVSLDSGDVVRAGVAASREEATPVDANEPGPAQLPPNLFGELVARWEQHGLQHSLGLDLRLPTVGDGLGVAHVGHVDLPDLVPTSVDHLHPFAHR